jgi:hypothetical protein
LLLLLLSAPSLLVVVLSCPIVFVVVMALLLFCHCALPVFTMPVAHTSGVLVAIIIFALPSTPFPVVPVIGHSPDPLTTP